MRSFFLLLPLLLMVRRSEGHVCGDLRTEFYECSELAHRTYVEEMKLGDDGRPDFRTRKTCTYMNDVIEICPNKLREHGCHSEEEMTRKKDQQLDKVLENVDNIEDWDSCKCPSVKADIDRVKALAFMDELEVKECSSEFHAFESTSEFIDLDFGFIGGVIVATGLVLAKYFF